MRADVLSLTQRIVFPALYTSKWSYCVICSILEQPYCPSSSAVSPALYQSSCIVLAEIHRAHSRSVAPASTVPCVDSLAAINVETFNLTNMCHFSIQAMCYALLYCGYMLHTAEWKLQTIQTSCVLNVFHTQYVCLTMHSTHIGFCREGHLPGPRTCYPHDADNLVWSVFWDILNTRQIYFFHFLALKNLLYVS